MRKIKLNDNQRLEIVKKYRTNLYSYNQLAREYNCNRGVIKYTINKLAPELKTLSRLERLSDSDKVSMVDKYINNELTIKDLSMQYNLDNRLVSRFLKLNNIKVSKRTYTLNEHYFDTINTEEKAYFLGFLYADGCIDDNKHNRMILSLQEPDLEILKRFTVEIQSNRPLLFTKKKKLSHQNKFVLTAESRYLCNSLIKLGCTPRKTFTLKFPTENQVPKCLLRHFIRGYFDGDGCISYSISRYKKKYSEQTSITVQSHIMSTLDFCNGIKDFVAKETNSNLTIYMPNQCRFTTRSLRANGTLKAYNFVKWLYADSNIYLKRKYDKLKEIELKLITSKQITR